ncbi:MAG: alpha/beta hydrolase [Cohaesibacter sp.]|nr:alpha/beta hydrolase [Cohaesibacter sp.]MCV6601697.1 alpha/beta hydrolase [Cohaesibacter sp.]
MTLLGPCYAFDYSPVSFTGTETQIIARGTIDSGTMERFLEISHRYPKAKTLVLQQIEGSIDDEANLSFSRYIHDEGFATLVPGDGLVASGGTDLFLAGRERLLESGACVGVHSWGWDDDQGKDFPKDAPEHQDYLDYYKHIGIPADFYWYTLDIASADDMHWMSAQEVMRYGMASHTPSDLGTAQACNMR